MKGKHQKQAIEHDEFGEHEYEDMEELGVSTLDEVIKRIVDLHRQLDTR